MGVRFQRANRKPGAYLPPSWPFAAPTVSLSSRDGGGCCFAGGEFIWSFICLFLIHLHSSGFHRQRLSNFCISNQNGSDIYTRIFYLLGPETAGNLFAPPGLTRVPLGLTDCTGMEHVPALSFLISRRVSQLASGRLMHFGSALLPPGLRLPNRKKHK